jgi:hypothetical protein
LEKYDPKFFREIFSLKLMYKIFIIFGGNAIEKNFYFIFSARHSSIKIVVIWGGYLVTSCFPDGSANKKKVSTGDTTYFSYSSLNF